MKTLKVDLGGKLPEGVYSLCIYIRHKDITEGGEGKVNKDLLLYCNQLVTKVDNEEDAGTVKDCWTEVNDDRTVSIELSGIKLDEGYTGYAIVVQPTSTDLPVLVAAYDNEDKTYWFIPEDLKIELLNC